MIFLKEFLEKVNLAKEKWADIKKLHEKFPGMQKFCSHLMKNSPNDSFDFYITMYNSAIIMLSS